MAVYVTDPGVTYANWTRFSVPFSYFRDDAPEYLLSVLNSGDSTTAVEGSYLFADDLELIYPSSGISDLKVNEPFLTVMPGRLVINMRSAKDYQGNWFYLFDMTGHTIMTKQLDNNQVMLPDNIPPGTYVALLQGKPQQFVQKVMIP
jgi:hypothetical protein